MPRRTAQPVLARRLSIIINSTVSKAVRTLVYDASYIYTHGLFTVQHFIPCV